MTPRPTTPDSVAPAKADSEETLDSGPPKASAKAPRDPERRCIATGETLRQSAMVRFVCDPDGCVAPDVAARLPGRGAWVDATRAAVELAVTRKAFSRAFKAQTGASEELADQVERLLAKRCLDLLGLARRSGDVIVGFDQVRDALRKARPGCMIEASDGSADGRSKLVGLAKALYLDDDDEADGPNGAPPMTTCLSARELGMALGRDRVIHGIVKEGRFAQSWTLEVARLSGFRPAAPEGSSSGTDR